MTRGCLSDLDQASELRGTADSQRIVYENSGLEVMLSQVESSWNPSPLPIAFLASRNLRAVLGPHVLLWFARHVSFFSPDAQAVLSSFECDPHSVWLSTKSCLRLKLQHSKIFQALAQGTVHPCEPPMFRKVKSRWFPHRSPGYLATWLGYYLCHHHWEMAWRFCLKVNPRLGKRSHGHVPLVSPENRRDFWPQKESKRRRLNLVVEQKN